MAKFDRYVLSQLLVLFGFFALVLVALFWINRAVVLFDKLIGDGQTAIVFLEFAALSMPKLVSTVLPIAAFAAAVYVTNRLNADSELTIMQATGSSAWRLTRPVLVFGIIVTLGMATLTNLLVPMAQSQLQDREAEISRNVSARLLTEGTFLHPTKGVTFYARIIQPDGVLRDVFMSDRRSEKRGTIYTASEAYLVRNGAATTLIMVNGLAQRLERDDLRLSTARFTDFSFDITSLMNNDTAADIKLSNLTTHAMLSDWASISTQPTVTAGAMAEELHTRIAQPLFCLIAAMIGFSALLIGGYSRFGVWREIIFAFGLLILLDATRGSLSTEVLSNAALWPMLYLPTAIGAVIALAMLFQAARPHWRDALPWRAHKRQAAP
ncbi:MAG: LPS export ABC transporter permease LptF [Sulfitobacter sp.]